MLDNLITLLADPLVTMDFSGHCRQMYNSRVLYPATERYIHAPTERFFEFHRRKIELPGDLGLAFLPAPQDTHNPGVDSSSLKYLTGKNRLKYSGKVTALSVPR